MPATRHAEVGNPVNGSRIGVVVVSENAHIRRRLVKLLTARDVNLVAGLGKTDRVAVVCEQTPKPVVVLNCDTDAAMAKARDLRRGVPDARLVLVVGSDETGRPLRAALRAQVEAVVYLDQVDEALMPTVRAVHAEQVVFPRRERRKAEVPVLSHRERQVLRLAVQGCSNDQIAGHLFLATSTVKSHLTSAFAKLAVRSRSEAAALILDPDEPAGRAIFAGITEDPQRFSFG
jgi:DNA-binding NarL/FixJ family response regulator